ncbi:MAG: sigma-70 family RNA polymerase sigma factor [Bryobacteraceae bacterium]
MVAITERTDLIQACRDGERDAFRALFEMYKDRVYSIAVRYAGNRTAAMDISQEVFVKLHRTIGGFRGEAGGAFESWLYRLTVNACMDYRRRNVRWVGLPDLPLLERLLFRSRRGSEFDGGLEQSETDRAIHAAVASLAPDLRIAVVLRYTEGLSYDEIAAATGCPPGTVASRLSRAHKQLAKRLVDLAPRKENER